MLQDIVSIGDKIELIKYTNQNGDPTKAKSYLSQLLDFQDQTHMCIAMPFENGRIIPLDVGSYYQMCFYTKGGLYQCLGVITDRYRSGNIFTLVVDMKSNLEKLQRRQYYRLECMIDMVYCSLQNEEEEKNYHEQGLFQDRLIKATIIDISGGGCKANSTEEAEKNQKIYMRFPLLMDKGPITLELLGKIVYTSAIVNRSRAYEHRIEFVDIKEEERENIVRYVFDEERKRRRKEKGLI